MDREPISTQNVSDHHHFLVEGTNSSSTYLGLPSIMKDCAASGGKSIAGVDVIVPPARQPNRLMERLRRVPRA